MTEKQKNIIYYKLQGYSPRHCSLICGVTDNYARKVLNRDIELDISDHYPDGECIIRRTVLDHIISTVGYVYVPKTQKYGYISLLGYLGFDYKQIRAIFPEDESSFLYMAIFRSNKAWKTLDPDFLGVELEDYKLLLRIK
jgi:hypothetical protein